MDQEQLMNPALQRDLGKALECLQCGDLECDYEYVQVTFKPRGVFGASHGSTQFAIAIEDMRYSASESWFDLRIYPKGHEKMDSDRYNTKDQLIGYLRSCYKNTGECID